MSAPREILDLVARFEQQLDAYKSGQYNETQLRREFLDPFFKALGWDVELPIRTLKPRGSGYPSYYKADVGNAPLKIAIEVDGNSHTVLVRKAQDRKKETLLTSLGWKVLRFSNREVTEHLADCVQTVLSTISKSRETTITSPTES